MTEAPDLRAADLTLEEKAALTSGADFWTTKAIDRVGIPSIMLTDGPHGLRKQAAGNDHLGLAGSVPAIFDRDEFSFDARLLARFDQLGRLFIRNQFVLRAVNREGGRCIRSDPVERAGRDVPLPLLLQVSA